MHDVSDDIEDKVYEFGNMLPLVVAALFAFLA